MATEEEIKALAKEVGETDWTDPEVQAWRREQLRIMHLSEKQLKANFVLQRMLRNDTQMEAIGKDLGEIRASIKMLEDFAPEEEKKE